MLELDPSIRRTRFQSIVNSSGYTCDWVVSTVLKAGDNETDVWRVGCGNGTWLVTLGQGNTSVESCSMTQIPYCIDHLQQFQWQLRS